MRVHIRPLTGDKLPIMRKAVRVESKRKAILLVGGAGMLRLLTLAVSATQQQQLLCEVRLMHILMARLVNEFHRRVW